MGDWAESICAMRSGSASPTRIFGFRATICAARDGFGYYGLFGVNVSFDRARMFRFGAGTRMYRGHTSGDPLGAVPPAGNDRQVAEYLWNGEFYVLKLLDLFVGDRGGFGGPIFADNGCLIREKRATASVPENVRNGSDLVAVGSALDRKGVAAFLAFH